VIYKTLLGTVVPSFGTYLYYYQIDVTHFTQMQYSYLQVVGYATLTTGAIAYSMFFKESEFYWMVVFACFVNFTGAVLTMLFCHGNTFGIPNFLFVILTSTVTDTLYISFARLPLMVLYAKVIPEKVEASLFAFLMGLSNLANNFIAKNWANLINSWVGCNRSNLEEKVWQLYAAQAACSIIPLFFIWLVPTRVQIEKVQRCFEYLELYEGKTEAECAHMQEDFDKLSPKTARRLGVKSPAEESQEK
jgi:hypothetical protein